MNYPEEQQVLNELQQVFNLFNKHLSNEAKRRTQLMLLGLGYTCLATGLGLGISQWAIAWIENTQYWFTLFILIQFASIMIAFFLLAEVGLTELLQPTKTLIHDLTQFSLNTNRFFEAIQEKDFSQLDSVIFCLKHELEVKSPQIESMEQTSINYLTMASVAVGIVMLFGRYFSLQVAISLLAYSWAAIALPFYWMPYIIEKRRIRSILRYLENYLRLRGC